MTQCFETDIYLPTPDATAKLAHALGTQLGAGDVVLLSGSIGAGKTHFARALIQSLLLEPEDVPSPTFTLVQTYETSKGEVWHADLYRLHEPSELVELGLADAFEEAICLIEWPDRLGSLTPQDALHLSFSLAESEEARTVTISAPSERWKLLKDHAPQ